MNRKQRRKNCAELRRRSITLESHDKVLDRLLPALPEVLARAVENGADIHDVGVLALHEGDAVALGFWRALIDPKGNPPPGRVSVTAVRRSMLEKAFKGLDARVGKADDAHVSVPVVVVTRQVPRVIVVSAPIPEPVGKVVGEG